MIDEVLYYGYNPSCYCSDLPEDICSAVGDKTYSDDYSKLKRKGEYCFEKSVESEIQANGHRETHVVPISAGLDSRAILAALIETPEIDSNSIITVSFGVPGTWDFDIGQQVSTAAGIDNIAIDLTNDGFDWSLDSLQKYTKTLQHPTRIFEGYINSRIPNLFNNDPLIWSGFLGDPTTGSHQPESPSIKWKSACEHFVEHNKHSAVFSDQLEDPVKQFPNNPYLNREYLSYEEQLDFAHRQMCFIAPLLFSENGNYATPFMQPEWLEYSLNLPSKYRANRSLFVEIVSEAYPELFSLPSDMRHGLPPTANKLQWYIQLGKLYTKINISKVLKRDYMYPGVNYLDFESEFRKQGQLKSTAEPLIKSFDNRNIDNIDPMEIWNDHQRGLDREKALRTMCSLELFLRK